MKSIFFFLFVSILIIFISGLLQTPSHKYVGRVIAVDSWDGKAKLLTKTDNNKDTVIIVIPHRYERFVVNQVLTAWTGGEMITDATTTPQD